MRRKQPDSRETPTKKGQQEERGGYAMKLLAVLIVGMVLGFVLSPVAAGVYWHHGHPPVGVEDQPFSFEKKMLAAPLHARIDAEMPAAAPIAATDENLIAGAHIYREQCSGCHGIAGHPSSYGKWMWPRAVQMWDRKPNGILGVSNDPVGETYWKVKNGIRLSGMPTFRHVLSEDQIWQISLLMANAEKPLPQEARDLVSTPLNK